jgi:uncharacterized protein (TIGR02597 family)
MKNPIKNIVLVAGAALFSFSSLSAVETDPVGFVSRDVNANADLKVGIPLHQAASFTGVVDSVATGTVNVTTTVPDVTTASHYLQVSSGVLLGKWYAVTASTASSVTVAEDLQAAGLVATDTFDVIPFWTLNTLFPAGGDIPPTSNPFSPVAFVALNDVTLSGTNLAAPFLYFYNDGTQGPAGWIQNGNLGGGLQGDTIISPESYITIRNLTSSPVSVTMAGTVPTYTLANDIVSSSTTAQDNQVPNPFPAGVTLASSDLFEDGIIAGSSNPFAPGDLLLVFTTTPTTLNPAPDRVFFYNDGTQGPAGWIENGNLAAGLQDDFELPLGGALIVRKAQGSDSVISWTPDIPYTL